MIKTIDLCWLAGLLEGEGHFSFYDKSIKISLEMSDSDIVCKAAKLMGNRVVHTYFKDGHKDTYRFNIYSNDAAAWMMILFELLGNRRREQIKFALEIWKRLEIRTYSKRQRVG